MFYTEVLKPVLDSIERFPERNAFCINKKFYTYKDFGQYISKVREAVINAKYENAKVGLVINDDIALPLGTLRLRKQGADGGHNGLTDIIEKLGTNVFCRLRFGLGDDFPRGRQVDFVLGQWKPSEEPIVDQRCDEAVEIIKSFVTQGVDRTMNLYNKK